MHWGSILVALAGSLVLALAVMAMLWPWLRRRLADELRRERSDLLDQSREAADDRFDRLRHDLQSIREQAAAESAEVRQACERMIDDVRKEMDAAFDRHRQAQSAELEELESRLHSRMKRLRARMNRRLRQSARAHDAAAAMSDGSLDGRSADHDDRAFLLHQRRMRAADELWSAVAELQRLAPLAWWMSRIDFDSASREASDDSAGRAVFQSMLGDLAWDDLDLAGAAKARPFLSPAVWAAYAALEAVIYSAYWRCSTLAEGLGLADVTNERALVQLVAALLPHERETVDDLGVEGCYRLVRSLERRLIDDLLGSLQGEGESETASATEAAGATNGAAIPGPQSTGAQMTDAQTAGPWPAVTDNGDGSETGDATDRDELDPAPSGTEPGHVASGAAFDSPAPLDAATAMRLADEVRQPALNTRLRDVIGAAR